MLFDYGDIYVQFGIIFTCFLTFNFFFNLSYEGFSVTVPKGLFVSETLNCDISSLENDTEMVDQSMNPKFMALLMFYVTFQMVEKNVIIFYYSMRLKNINQESHLDSTTSSLYLSFFKLYLLNVTFQPMAENRFFFFLSI